MLDRPSFDSQKRSNGGLPIIPLFSIHDQIDIDHYIENKSIEISRQFRFLKEIQKQLGVSQDEAEAYKVGGSYDEHGVVPQEVERIIEGVAEVMAGEFQRSIDFFLATSADTNVSRICLSGGSAKVSALETWPKPVAPT